MCFFFRVILCSGPPARGSVKKAGLFSLLTRRLNGMLSSYDYHSRLLFCPTSASVACPVDLLLPSRAACALIILFAITCQLLLRFFRLPSIIDLHVTRHASSSLCGAFRLRLSTNARTDNYIVAVPANRLAARRGGSRASVIGVSLLSVLPAVVHAACKRLSVKVFSGSPLSGFNAMVVNCSIWQSSRLVSGKVCCCVMNAYQVGMFFAYPSLRVDYRSDCQSLKRAWSCLTRYRFRSVSVFE